MMENRWYSLKMDKYERKQEKQKQTQKQKYMADITTQIKQKYKYGERL